MLCLEWRARKSIGESIKVARHDMTSRSLPTDWVARASGPCRASGLLISEVSLLRLLCGLLFRLVETCLPTYLAPSGRDGVCQVTQHIFQR
jgi:hypothetical protein